MLAEALLEEAEEISFAYDDVFQAEEIKPSNLVSDITKYKRALGWRQEAREKFNEGDYELALKPINKAILEDPSDVLSWKMKGIILFKLGPTRYVETSEVIAEICTLDQSEKGWGFKLAGVILKHVGNLPEALEAFDVAIGENNSDEEAWRFRGAIQLRRGDFASAIEAFEQAYVHKTKELLWLWRMTGLAQLQLPDPDRAAWAFLEALKIDRRDTVALVGLSIAQYGQKLPGHSLRTLDSISEQDSSRIEIRSIRELVIKSLIEQEENAIKNELYGNNKATETVPDKVSAVSDLEAPPHPGPIIKEELFDRFSLSVTHTAAKLGVSRAYLSKMLGGILPLTENLAKGIAPLFQEHAKEGGKVYTPGQLLVLQHRRDSFLEDQRILEIK
ncbi:MAG: tetratricopeptide repeat protein [Nitrospira sp.]|nr:tetratricopeptide repeat protein [Nitrospira sp.]